MEAMILLRMIKEYETTRLLLQKRMHELNAILANPELKSKEREQLTMRRDLLVTERIELLHVIREMYKHMNREEATNGRENIHGATAIRQNENSGAAEPSGRQPEESENCTAGAA